MKQPCSWCHTMNVVVWGQPNFCGSCRHRAELPRASCNCVRCRQEKAEANAEGRTPRAVEDMTPAAADALLDQLAELTLLHHFAGHALGGLAMRHGLDSGVSAKQIAGQAFELAKEMQRLMARHERESSA